MKKSLIASLLLMLTAVSATAGGILTNTNQSVLFLKNPARDAAIGLDGVYSNPAGVAFMPEGFHVAFNWQYAHQTRTITSTNPVFQLGKKNNGMETKDFEGVADLFLFVVKSLEERPDWQMLDAYDGRTPFLLGGSIGPDDVERILDFRHPQFAGVSVSSGFENESGEKDVEKLRRFVQALR